MPTDRPAAGGRALRYVIGALLAAAALYASLLKVDHAALRDAMHTASASWTVAAVASTIICLTFVTWRSALLLDVPAAVNWGALWSAVVVGQAVNIVFPLRFGEAARVAKLSARTGWSISHVVMALAVERFFDLSAFAAAVLLLLLFGRMPARFSGAAPTILLSLLLMLAVVIAGIRMLPWVQGIARRSLAASSSETGTIWARVCRWLLAQTVDVSRGWSALTRGPRLAAVLGLSALVLTSSVMTNYLVFRAFHLPVPASAAFVLLVVLQIGTAVVSVPGNVGVFQYLTIVTLASWNVPESTALAAALILHVVSLGPRVALGGLAALSARQRNQ